MTESNARRRLIIVCGLPGAGKTTLAKSLEQSLQAIRFSADEWMEALSLDLYNEESRGKIEALQWTLGKELLARGLIVIVEWGTWGRSERDQLRLEARALWRCRRTPLPLRACGCPLGENPTSRH